MDMTNAVNAVAIALAAVAALLFSYSPARGSAAARTVAALALTLAAAALATSLADARWLPAGALLTNPDGSPRDPRLMTALAVGAAALTSFLPGRDPGRHPRGRIGMLLPGILLAGVAGAVGYIIGLRTPLAVSGLALGGFIAGTALRSAFGSRGDRATLGLAVLACGLGILVAGAVPVLHGAGVAGIRMNEGMHADTLGAHLTYVRTAAPHDSLRRMRVALGSGGRTDSLWLELRGAADREQHWLAAGGLLSGPVVVPLALAEQAGNPHGVTWMRKGESIESGDARITFEKFRFEMGEPIRLFADLRVEMGGRVYEAHPGAKAHSKGEDPFVDQVPGYGPISVAGIDADNGRVGLILPRMTGSGIVRTLTLALRLRPGLELALAGFAIALVGLALSFGRGRPD